MSQEIILSVAEILNNSDSTQTKKTNLYTVCESGQKSDIKHIQATIGKKSRVIREYIRNQLEDDIASDQTSFKEFTDPFTGNKRK